MSSENSYKITFSFNGKAPANWKSALSNQERASWVDPQSSGSKVLQEILRNSGIDSESQNGDESLDFSFPSQQAILSKLLGLHAVSDANTLLIAGTQQCRNLYGVAVTTHQLLADGTSVCTEQKAKRTLLFMTQNGICVQADYSVGLSTGHLPGARFFASEEDMEYAGLHRWGENGGEAWRAIVTVMHGKKILLNGSGQMIEPGDNPEELINAISN